MTSLRKCSTKVCEKCFVSVNKCCSENHVVNVSNAVDPHPVWARLQNFCGKSGTPWVENISTSDHATSSGVDMQTQSGTPT